MQRCAAMTEADEDYGVDAVAVPTFAPVKLITRDDDRTVRPENAEAYFQDLAVLNMALPKDDLEDFNFATEAEHRRAADLDFSFKFKQRILTNRNRYARDTYEVLIGRPSDDAKAKPSVAVETSATGAASSAPPRAKFKVMKKDTPRAMPTPVAAPSSSSSSSDDDYGFGRMAFASCSAPLEPLDAPSADAVALVTWEQSINWRGSSSEDTADAAETDSEDCEDAADIKGAGYPKALVDSETSAEAQDAAEAKAAAAAAAEAAQNLRVRTEHMQLLAAKSSSSLESPDIASQRGCIEAAAPKPEPLTLRNHSLLSCRWLDDVQWTRQHRAKGSSRPSALGQMTISRHVRLPDESNLKRLLCVSVDDFYSVNLHPLKNQRSRLGVEHSAYAPNSFPQYIFVTF